MWVPTDRSCLVTRLFRCVALRCCTCCAFNPRPACVVAIIRQSVSAPLFVGRFPVRWCFLAQVVDHFYSSRDVFVEEGTLATIDDVTSKVFVSKPGFALGAVPLDSLGPGSDWLPKAAIEAAAEAAAETAAAAVAAAVEAGGGIESVAAGAGSSGVADSAGTSEGGSISAGDAKVEGAPDPAAASEPSPAVPSGGAPPSGPSGVGSSAKEDGVVAEPVPSPGPAEPTTTAIILLGDIDSVATAPSPAEAPPSVDPTVEVFEQIMTARVRPKMQVCVPGVFVGFSVRASVLEGGWRVDPHDPPEGGCTELCF